MKSFVRRRTDKSGRVEHLPELKGETILARYRELERLRPRDTHIVHERICRFIAKEDARGLSVLGTQAEELWRNECVAFCKAFVRTNQYENSIWDTLRENFFYEPLLFRCGGMAELRGERLQWSGVPSSINAEHKAVVDFIFACNVDRHVSAIIMEPKAKKTVATHLEYGQGLNRTSFVSAEKNLANWVMAAFKHSGVFLIRFSGAGSGGKDAVCGIRVIEGRPIVLSAAEMKDSYELCPDGTRQETPSIEYWTPVLSQCA